MPSKSKKQQDLFKTAMGAKKGNTEVKGAAKEIAKKMPKKKIKEFPKKKIKEFIKKESALANELNALVESAQPENVFDFAYQHVMSLYLEKLDAVGEEDNDINNDGKSNSTDEYLKKRRETISAAIGEEEAEESFRNMRITHVDRPNRAVTINWNGKDYKAFISESGDIDFEDDLSEDEQDALSNFCMFSPEMERYFPSEEF